MANTGTLHLAIRDDAVRHLAAGTSVDLQGVPGSGCSVLSRAICAEMQDAGWHVVRAQGIAALQDRPLEALSIAGLVPRHGGTVGASGGSGGGAGTAGHGHGASGGSSSGASGPPTPTTSAVHGLLAATRGNNTLLAVDDVEELDEASAGAITAAHAISAFPILSTSHPTPRPVRPPWLVTAAIRPGVVVAVPPLGYVDAQGLVSDLLGGPIDATSFARIFAASGGLPGIVTQIINSARLHGALKLVNGIWTAKPELWLPEMSRAVEPLLHNLSPQAIDGLHALALAGTIDVQTALKFVSWPVLEELDGYKLLQFLPRGHEMLVSVFPQAIVEFFRHRSVGARHLRVDSEVMAAFDDDGAAQAGDAGISASGSAGVAGGSRVGAGVGGFRPRPAATGWTAGLPGDASAPNLPTLSVDNQALIENRLLVDHWHRELLVRRAEWEQNPTPRTAAALIRTMLITGADPAGVAKVRERTPRTGDHRDLVAFDGWYALYVGTVEHKQQVVRDVLAASRGDAEEWTSMLEAIEDFIDLQTDYCPDPADLETPPDDAPADTREIVAAVRAELFLARGRPAEALQEIAKIGEPVTEFGRSRKAIVPWALLLDGQVDEAIAAAEHALAQARLEHDIEGVVAAAYVLAFAFTVRGRTSELRTMLGNVLSTGILPALERPQHVALLSIAAALAATEGRPTTARTLAQQALALQTGPGPVPLGSPTQAIAELDLAEMPPLAARAELANRLWAEAEGLLERQYLVSGYVCGVLALVAHPTKERAAVLAEVSKRIPAPFIRQGEKLVAAYADGSEAALMAAGDELADDGHVWEATAAYSAGLAALRTRGGSAGAGRAHDEAKAKLEAWGADAALGLRSAAEGAELTAREDEIARLAASGLSNQEIARRLLISVRTVENHLHRVFRKLGVDNRAGMSRALSG